MNRTLLLFDDIPRHLEEVHNALLHAVNGQGEVKDFAPGVGGEEQGTYEVRLEKDLLKPPNFPADLIVADRDLSGYSPQYRGLSEDTVRDVADVIGIPHCGYARGDREDDNDFVKRGDEREACIRLSLKPDISRFAQRVVAIADGFLAINERLGALKEPSKSPGQLLAAVLQKPEYGDKISLYASGDQNRLASAHRVRGTSQEDRKRRLVCLLGYWLWDSVLRFPGVTVGEIPASSYLNIRRDVFIGDEKIRRLFSKAEYRGPFAGAKVAMWWRGILDDIIAESGCVDGRTFASEKLGTNLPQSQCCEDPTKPAGYYCILSEQPVSLENSEGGLPWLPRGADLARVSRSKLQELGPWL